MSRRLADLGERVFFYRVAFLAFASCTVFAVMVAFYLMDQRDLGLPGAGLVVLAGWLVAALITAIVWWTTGVASHGLVQMMSGAGNLPPARGFSLEESLVARGAYDEAVRAYERRLASAPGDVQVMLALAALSRDHLDDPARAESLLLAVRRTRPGPAFERSVGNALIDLYATTGQRGKQLAELSRFAEMFRGTPEGERARSALLRIKREQA